MREQLIKQGLDGVFYKYDQINDDFVTLIVNKNFVPEYKNVGGFNNNMGLAVCGLFKTTDGARVDVRDNHRHRRTK